MNTTPAKRIERGKTYAALHTCDRNWVLTHEAVETSDVVITMGCGDACPVFPGISYRDWALEDPAGKGIDAVRPIRDEIKTRVQALVAELLPSDAAAQSGS